MILILTDDADFHTDLVVEMLQHKRAPYCRFETHRIPTKTGLTLTCSAGRHSERLTIERIPLWLDDVASVWFRRPAAARLPRDLDTHTRDIASRETFHAIDGLYGRLADRFWVNWAPNDRLANQKPHQLRVATEAGLRIPDTLITTEPDEVRRFFDAHDGDIIYKPMHAFVRHHGDVGYGVYTSRVTKRDIEERLGSVGRAPCLFQGRVPKRVEYRITIIGDDVFPVAIDSQIQETSSLDWRRSSNAWRDMPHRVEPLPDGIINALQRLMCNLGLVFGTVDMILTPAGEYVFLEVNPAGQWYWIELATGVPLLDCLTNVLMRAVPPQRMRDPAWCDKAATLN